jgi:hypothetical protein
MSLEMSKYSVSNQCSSNQVFDYFNKQMFANKAVMQSTGVLDHHSPLSAIVHHLKNHNLNGAGSVFNLYSKLSHHKIRFNDESNIACANPIIMA